MRVVRLGWFGAALAIAGCTGNAPPETLAETLEVTPPAPLAVSQVVDDERVPRPLGGFAQRREITFPMLSAQRALASCPEDEAFAPPQPIRIRATPVELGSEKAMGEALSAGVTYAFGWHLTSDEPNFGGLSGLDILDSGDLLAVSDAGAFVQIGMDDGQPNGSGAISYMRGEDGGLLDGKRSSDSEGLHVGFGLAAVSFERDHRIAVFNLDDCGAAARGVPVSGGIVSVSDGQPPSGLPDDLPENGGLEALTFHERDFLTGLEEGGRHTTPLFRPAILGEQFYRVGALSTPGSLKLTGLDTLGTNTFGLFRRYLPLFGNTIEVRRYETLDHAGKTLFRIERPLTVDNFEGIATAPLPDGGVRIYIVSDDNFSGRQRTLLMAFDVAPEAVPN